MNYYINAIKNYALFSGRARRKEYWMFVLFNVLFAILASILDRVVGDTFEMSGISLGYGYIYLLYALIVFLPGLAVLVRRLHDINKSGWMFLLCLFPIVGWIWLLVLLFTDGTPGVNKYGQNPKGIGNNQFDSIDM